MVRVTSGIRFWVLFGLLFALIAVEGGVAIYVLARFERSVVDLRTMQNAGMRVDEFGLQLNNFVKEMKVSTAIAPEGLGAVPLPPTANLAQAAQVLVATNVEVRSEPLAQLLAGVTDLLAAVDDYGQDLRTSSREKATVAYIDTIEPLADRLMSKDFPASQTAILTQVTSVGEANQQSGILARRVLTVSLLATLVVGLGLARLIRVSLQKSAAQERELLRHTSELEIAHSIQTSVLPRDLRLSGYDVGAIMVTAEEVGGDFYEFRRAAGGGAWIAVGDVTGHGLRSGLVMLMVQSMFSMLTQEDDRDPSPKRLLEQLNRSLFSNLRDRLGEDKYMTMVVARLFPDGRMVYAGAHTELLVYRRAEDTVVRIPTDGMWLGLVEDVASVTEEHEVGLGSGDIALFHTDGMTEAKDADGRVFDLERVADRLRAWHGESASVMVGRLADAARQWAPVPADDISLMAIKRS
jgi:serine phosphatase RsbU (regulator of sigma subunit)